jgi:hypothetical protein
MDPAFCTSLVSSSSRDEKAADRWLRLLAKFDQYLGKIPLKKDPTHSSVF